jgi:putative Mg2+ transporter-C (MgtC) family protein
MPLTLTWTDVGLRIVLTILTGAAIGYDRDVEGHPAGLRTTILVALAACLSMLQANWLMNSVGKAPDSFVVLDLMRLPLGILTGVGFIGGGVILKRGDAIHGVTTAATLWFVTVVGLCFGCDQIGLGVAGAVLGLLTLRALKLVELKLLQQRRVSELWMKWKIDDFDAAAILSVLRAADLQISGYMAREDRVAHVQEFRCSVQRLVLRDEHGLPLQLEEMTRLPGVLEWEWKD